MADAETALKLGRPDQRLLHNLARIYAQAAGKVDAENKDRFRRELASRYEAQAVDLLRRALTKLRTTEQRSAFWWDSVYRDTAFDPIRKSPTFVRLGAECPRPKPVKNPETSEK